MFRATVKPEAAASLPYGRHTIEPDDVAAVAAVLTGEALTTGPMAPRFEQAFARAVHAPEAVVCANGTAALHLAGRALGIGPGMVAIVPAITFVATANAMRQCGAEILFADVDPETGLMEAWHLEEALARAPAGAAHVALPVHLNGQCADLPTLQRVAARRGLRLIEDACHALGAQYRDADGREHAVGAAAHADLVAFSFHPVKAIAMGEGGAVTGRDRALARAMRRDRSHGLVREADEFLNPDSFDPAGAANPWSYELAAPGYNYRASDIQCALGLSQLAKLERFIARRRALAARYDQALINISSHLRLLKRNPACTPAWHIYPVRIDFRRAGLDRATVMRRLAASGIGTQVHYYPVHRQPYYATRVATPNLPGADLYYERTLTLPLFPAMADADVDRVAAALARALRT